MKTFTTRHLKEGLEPQLITQNHQQGLLLKHLYRNRFLVFEDFFKLGALMLHNVLS